MRTVLCVQEISRSIGNQQEARIYMALGFGHAITGIGNCAPVDSELVLVKTRLERTERHSPETICVLFHLIGLGPL